MQDEIKQTTEWFSTERFKEITRLYSARQVVEQRGTLSQDYTVAREAASGFYKLLRKLFNTSVVIAQCWNLSDGALALALRTVVGGDAAAVWNTVMADPQLLLHLITSPSHRRRRFHCHLLRYHLWSWLGAARSDDDHFVLHLVLLPP